MLLRICVIVVAVLLVGGPAQAAEIVDAQAEQAPDALLLPVGVPLAPPTEARVAIAETPQVPPVSPTVSRVFRPPRAPVA